MAQFFNPLYPEFPSAFQAIAHLKAFLLWRKGAPKPNGKFAKVPHYASGFKRSGKQGSPPDLAQLVTLSEAWEALNASNTYSGVGLALRSDLGVIAIDIDHCLPNGQLKPEFTALVAETYAEISPSGQGLRLLVWGNIPRNFSDHRAGFELFHTAGFVTLTGERWPTSPETISQLSHSPAIADAISFYCSGADKVEKVNEPQRLYDDPWLGEVARINSVNSINEGTLADVEKALAVLPARYADDYADWINVGQALKTLEGAFPAEAADLWHQFSQRSAKYNESEAEARWVSFAPNSITYKSIFHLADQADQSWRKARPQYSSQKSVWEPMQYDLSKPKAPDWLIKGILPTGLGVFAGQPGVGKSSCLLPIILTVAGFEFPNSGLAIKYPRRVILVTEAPLQIILMLHAFSKKFGWNPADIQQAITIIPGRRADKRLVPELCALIEMNKLTVETPLGTRPISPWLIFDTQNSSFGLEDENNNSEVGELMGLIRIHLIHDQGASVGIVCHAAKSTSAAKDDTWARGASAFVGDAEFTAAFAMDQTGMRTMHLNKIRFEASVKDIRFASQTLPLEVDDHYGGKEKVPVRLTFPQAMDASMLADARLDAIASSKETILKSRAAEFHLMVRREQGDQTAFMQTCRGNPALPPELDEANAKQFTSNDLKPFKANLSDIKDGLITEHGWAESGELIYLKPQG